MEQKSGMKDKQRRELTTDERMRLSALASKIMERYPEVGESEIDAAIGIVEMIGEVKHRSPFMIFKSMRKTKGDKVEGQTEHGQVEIGTDEETVKKFELGKEGYERAGNWKLHSRGNIIYITQFWASEMDTMGEEPPETCYISHDGHGPLTIGHMEHKIVKIGPFELGFARREVGWEK